MSDELFHAALEYSRRGLSVIPVGKDKKPLIPWLSYQKERAIEEQIRSWWGKYPQANIGVVTGKISGITVFDFDSQEAIEYFLANFKGATPCVDTPRGMHAYFTYEEGTRNSVRVNGLDIDVRSNGGYIILPPSINTDGKPYRWIQSFYDVPLSPLPEFFLQCIKDSFNNSFIYRGVTGETQESVTKRYEALQNVTIKLDDGSRDNSLFHIANCLIKGGMTEPNTQYVLDIMAKHCSPPFPDKEILIKIQSAIHRAKRRERNFQDEVEEWVSVTSGYWNVTECNQALQSVTKEEKTAVRVAVHRLYKAGKIEKHGDKDGCYRRIETDCEEIDFLNTTDEVLNISWPFLIEQYVKTLPKNIVIVAGEPNAGKTAFLLITAEMNMHKHEVYYFSSEMGAMELKDRLSKFNRPLNSWKVKFKERASNFADVIRPDAINIIDFLEVHDEFYKIGGLIKDIYDKLKTGIAVIAIQKNKGTDFGLGGMRSLEKARLYLSMEPGKIRIVKGKNWTGPMNPNGLQCDFKLVQGCHFDTDVMWRK